MQALQRLLRRFNFESYRSAWLVGGVFFLLFVSGVIWRGLYLSFLDKQADYYQAIEQLMDKSSLVEHLIMSARNRSVLISQMLFMKQADQKELQGLLERYDQEAWLIIQEREKYAKIADEKERVLLDRHAELAIANRAVQDYVIELLKEGELQAAIEEYSASMLPVQEAPLRLLDQLQTHVATLRLNNTLAFNENARYLKQVVSVSSIFYLLVLLALAAFVLFRLCKLDNAQRDLQAKLNERLQETTAACELADQELIRQAHYDAVTHLMNRHAVEIGIEGLIAKANRVSLLLIDLDNFKWFNDTLGHAAGDQLLVAFAKQMIASHSLIADDLVGRLGGDEFAVALVDASPEEEMQVCQYLLKTIAKLNDQYLPAKPLGASVGIARYPEHGTTVDLLMRYADMAMYEAKASGKGRACVFDNHLLDAMYVELDLEQALKQALQAGEIQVFYQAQYRLSDLHMSGAEALMRWQRSGQWVSPAMLIPVAEKTGHIHALGLQVLDKVLADINRWDSQGQHLAKVAVNISPVQMRLESLTENFIAAIAKSGVDSTRIEVEITESAFVEMELCTQFIQQLEQRGMQISLDDFGTGYSSLSQITRLNFDTLKIDQSFVAQIEHSEQVCVLVKTIIDMGHNLGLTLLAEGIETRQQYEMLKEWGCDQGQGYWFARPVPANQFSFDALPSLVS